jgi:hypothetical protein
VSKKYDKLHANQKGGVIYLFYTLNEMFQMSREVKEAMLKFLDIFKRNGISKYTGENVLVASEEILGVCKRLDAVGSLQDEHVMDVLSGLSICTNTRFRDTFKHLKQSAELDNLTILGTIPADATPLEQIEAILDKAMDQYDNLCNAQLWNRVSRGGPSALNSIVDQVHKCWNCNGDDHQAKQCPKPKNKDLYNKNQKAFWDRRGGKASGGSGSSGRGKSNSGKSDNPEYVRKKWEQQGLSFVDGKLLVYCKKCGPNSTHSSKYHGEWEKKGALFKLPANHPYVMECTRLVQSVTSASVPAPAAPGPGPVAPPPASAPAATTVTIDRSRFERALSDYERNPTDPNASGLSEMFRSMFLN